MWYAIEGHDGPDVLSKRMEARPAHVARLTALRDQGGCCWPGRVRRSMPRIRARRGSAAASSSPSSPRSTTPAPGPMPIPTSPPASTTASTCVRSSPCCHERAAVSVPAAQTRGASSGCAPCSRRLRAGTAGGESTTATSTSAMRAPATGRGHFSVDIVSPSVRGPVAIGPASGRLRRARADDGHRYPRPVDPGANPGRAGTALNAAMRLLSARRSKDIA